MSGCLDERGGGKKNTEVKLKCSTSTYSREWLRHDDSSYIRLCAVLFCSDTSLTQKLLSVSCGMRGSGVCEFIRSIDCAISAFTACSIYALYITWYNNIIIRHAIKASTLQHWLYVDCCSTYYVFLWIDYTMSTMYKMHREQNEAIARVYAYMYRKCSVVYSVPLSVCMMCVMCIQ